MAVIPPELIDNILKLLQGDKTVLKTCLLTCRDWSATCRHLLYRDTRADVSAGDGVAGFVTFLHEYRNVGPYIRSLHLGMSPNERRQVNYQTITHCVVDIQCLKTLLSSLVNLTSLSMEVLYMRAESLTECTHPIPSVFSPPRPLRLLSMQDCSVLTRTRHTIESNESLLEERWFLLQLLSLFSTIDTCLIRARWLRVDLPHNSKTSELELHRQLEVPLEKISIRSLSFSTKEPPLVFNILTTWLVLEDLESLKIPFREPRDLQIFSSLIPRMSSLQTIDLEFSPFVTFVTNSHTPDEMPDLSTCPNLQTFSVSVVMTEHSLALWDCICAILQTAPTTLSNIRISVGFLCPLDVINSLHFAEILRPLTSLSHLALSIREPSLLSRGGSTIYEETRREIEESFSWLRAKGALRVSFGDHWHDLWSRRL